MYRSNYKCSDCKTTFEKMTKNFPKKDPLCPNCKRAQRVNFKSSVSDKTHNLDAESRVKEMIESRHPPSMGKSNFTKAMDATAEIVMSDYGLTNLQDNLRAGDSMAPKLAPHLEQQVDQVFKPQKPIMGMNQATNLNKALTAQINAGRYAGQSGMNDITAKAQQYGKSRADSTGYKVPTNIILDNNRIPT